MHVPIDDHALPMVIRFCFVRSQDKDLPVFYKMSSAQDPFYIVKEEVQETVSLFLIHVPYF